MGTTTVITGPMGDDDRRRDLARFLRNRRERIAPAAAGLATAARRRARGLLREEVAMIAGVGLTWYTWLEQARPIKPSVHVLGGIARALRLSDAERTHLFRLARPDLEATGPTALPAAVSLPLQRTMDGLAPNPAYATNAAWDVIGWNRPAALVFGDFATVETERRNLVYLIFCDPSWQALFREWEAISAFAVAQLRESTVRLGCTARSADLIRMLERDSPAFRAHWRRCDVQRPMPQSKILEHRRSGRLNLDYLTFQADSDRDVRLTIYTPADAESTRRIEMLAGHSDRNTQGRRRAAGMHV